MSNEQIKASDQAQDIPDDIYVKMSSVLDAGDDSLRAIHFQNLQYQHGMLSHIEIRASTLYTTESVGSCPV